MFKQRERVFADYIRQVSMEATFRSHEIKDVYIYGYVTYDKSLLKGSQISKVNRYNIQAQGCIPITKNEIVDMRLFAGTDDSIVEFTMQYRDISTRLNIRSDYGHGTTSPHIDIEQFDQNGRKVLNLDVPQDYSFLNYESAINAVFMQVEKYSPLAGARYWLSPTEIYEEKVQLVDRLRRQARLKTSLTILARMINIQLYESTRSGELDEQGFNKLVESQIDLCKQKEKEFGGELNISSLTYSTDMSILPFLFFSPEGSEYSFHAYHSDGSEIPITGEGLMGIVSEKKRGINIIRDLDNTERIPSDNRNY